MKKSKVLFLILAFCITLVLLTQENKTLKDVETEREMLEVNNSLFDQFNLTKDILEKREKEYKESSFLTSSSSKDTDENPDIKRIASEIIESRGFKSVIYQVEVSDGYILRLYRIPCTLKEEEDRKCEKEVLKSKKAVLLVHGLLDSSDAWIVNSNENSIAFRLANEGYDVWLANTRGNKYSLNHKTLVYNKDKVKFWNFSFHEKGLIDIVDITKFIIEKVKESEVQKISYIGHSQGTSAFFAGYSTLPEEFSKLFNGMAALGPVTSLKNIKSDPVNTVIDHNMLSFLRFIGINSLFEDKDAIKLSTYRLCNIFKSLCNWVTNIIAGNGAKNDDFKRVLAYTSHYPAGAALKEFEHLGQNKVKDCFCKFDSEFEYRTDLIKDFKIGLFVGKEDKLATVEDNRKFYEKMVTYTNSIKFYKEYEDIGHLSFFVTTKKDLIDDIVNFINQIQ